MSEPQSRRRGIALIGARGTGKSTVGRIVAARTGLPFHDADAALEEAAGKSIPAIFAEDGEPAFRDWEERVLADLLGRGDLVLATGGGVVLRASNRGRLRDMGLVVWLTADPEVLAARLQADRAGLAERPALTPAGTLAELADVLAARTPLYQALADAVIDTQRRAAEEVAEAVIALWTENAWATRDDGATTSASPDTLEG